MGKACNTYDEDLGSKSCKTYECLREGGFLNWTKLAKESAL